jgi:hypothetical protein
MAPSCANGLAAGRSEALRARIPARSWRWRSRGTITIEIGPATVLYVASPPTL